MSFRGRDLKAFLDAHRQSVRVAVAEAHGSTPREAGTEMVVAENAQFGTIGGGQLEFMAIDRARALLASEKDSDRLDIPLGPGIGQCCGGRVVLAFNRLDAVSRTVLVTDWRNREADEPAIYVFGAGHVGMALARALSLLPFSVSLVETRPELLNGAPEGVAAIATPLPEAVIREADAGAAFVAVTHDHALDFLIAREALLRGDAGYVGMIGSKTKRVQFGRWFKREGGDPGLIDALFCPIGGASVDDKRPEIIAALTSAEIIGSMADVSGADHPVKKVADRVREQS